MLLISRKYTTITIIHIFAFYVNYLKLMRNLVKESKVTLPKLDLSYLLLAVKSRGAGYQFENRNWRFWNNLDPRLYLHNFSLK